MTDEPTNEDGGGSLEEQLGVYGDFLRTEMSAPAAPAADIAVLRPRRNRKPKGLLVAAAVLLIAGLSVVALRADDAPPSQVVSEGGAPADIATQPEAAEEDQPAETDEPTDNDTTDNDTPDEATPDGTPDEATPDGTTDDNTTDEATPDGTTDDNTTDEATLDETPDDQPLTCESGELVDERCRVVGDAPLTVGGDCPTTADVFEDGSGCYAVVPAECPAPFAIINEICSAAVDATTLAASCPDDFLLIDGGMCQQTSQPEFACAPDRVLEGNQCTYTYVLGEGLCPVEAGFIEDATGCYKPEDAACGDNVPVPIGTDCRLYGMTWQECDTSLEGACPKIYQGDRFCPDDPTAWHVLNGSTCVYYQDIETGGADGVTNICPDSWEMGGHPSGDGDQPLVCEIYLPMSVDCGAGEPYTAEDSDPDACFDDNYDAPVLCDVTGETVEVEGPADCWTLVPAECPSPDCKAYQPHIDPAPCPGALDVATLECEVTSEATAACSEGAFDPTTALCIVAVVASQPEPTCPAGVDIVEVDGDCYQETTTAQACGDLPPISGGCRQPVDALPATTTCAEGYELVDAECIAWVEPVPGG